MWPLRAGTAKPTRARCPWRCGAVPAPSRGSLAGFGAATAAGNDDEAGTAAAHPKAPGGACQRRLFGTAVFSAPDLLLKRGFGLARFRGRACWWCVCGVASSRFCLFGFLLMVGFFSFVCLYGFFLSVWVFCCVWVWFFFPFPLAV